MPFTMEQIVQYGFSGVIAIVLLYDMLKARREMSVRIENIEDRYKKVLEGLVKESIRTNQQLISSLSNRPCMVNNDENKK